MKILFVMRSTWSHARSGGMENATRDFVAALARRGAILGLVTTPGHRSEDLKHFTHVWTAGRRPGRYSLRWWIDTWAQSGWAEWSPDVIVSVSGAGWLVLAANPNTPSLSHCHGTSLTEAVSSLSKPSPRELVKVPLNIARVPREVITYRKSTVVVTVGDAVTQQLRKWPYRLSDDRLSTVHNGVEPSRFAFDEQVRARTRARLGLAAEVVVGVYLGRLHYQKGVDLAIRALALQRRPAHLLVCGTGPDHVRLERLAERIGVRRHVSFLGGLQASEIRDVLSAADLCLVPSRRREGAPLVILEATAARLPIIATQAVPVPEQLQGHVDWAASVEDFSRRWDDTVIGLRTPEGLPRPLWGSSANDALVDRVMAIANRRGEARGTPCH